MIKAINESVMQDTLTSNISDTNSIYTKDVVSAVTPMITGTLNTSNISKFAKEDSVTALGK